MRSQAALKSYKSNATNTSCKCEVAISIQRVASYTQTGGPGGPGGPSSVAGFKLSAANKISLLSSLPSKDVVLYFDKLFLSLCPILEHGGMCCA